MNELISWLIIRMGWVYKFVTQTLHLPSFVGFIVLGLLVIIFFYDLYDIFRQRKKSVQALVCLFVVLVVPLGTLIYLLIGRPYLHKARQPIEGEPLTDSAIQYQPDQPLQPGQAAPQNGQSYNTAGMSAVKTTSILGTIVGTIAIIAGAVTVFFFIMITIAIIQCQNDPKCM